MTSTSEHTSTEVTTDSSKATELNKTVVSNEATTPEQLTTPEKSTSSTKTVTPDEVARTPETATPLKKKKKKANKNKKKKKQETYSKAVETMFRNAYRAQLDLISLATTKANIMISLNGFIVSILLVSGAVIYEKTPDFFIPMVIFLITSAISIYFALSSASPDIPSSEKTFVDCLWLFLQRKITWAQFLKYRRPIKKEFDRKTSNILLFEDYTKLSKDVFLECMDELILKPQQLYKSMSEQLYILGQLADKKYRALSYSYTVFRWGLVSSILFFIMVSLIHHLFPNVHVTESDIVGNFKKKTFDGIYEPSGVQALADGRIVLVEDEISSALHMMKITNDGDLVEDKAMSKKLMKAFSTQLNDLEAITLGPDNYLYAITSHQRNSSGERMKNRELIIRFKIEGNKVINPGIYRDLYLSIEESGILGKPNEQGTTGINNINIESLAFNDKNQLLIGFRSPFINEKNIIGVLTNPSDIFENKARAVIDQQPILLNLHGGGIRAMSYDSTLSGYLMTNEIYNLSNNLSNNEKERYSQLFLWNGNSARHIHHLNGPKQKNIEGITTLKHDDKRLILVVSDNGNKIKGRNANYLLLEYSSITR